MEWSRPSFVATSFGITTGAPASTPSTKQDERTHNVGAPQSARDQAVPGSVHCAGERRSERMVVQGDRGGSKSYAHRRPSSGLCSPIASRCKQVIQLLGELYTDNIGRNCWINGCTRVKRRRTNRAKYCQRAPPDAAAACPHPTSESPDLNCDSLSQGPTYIHIADRFLRQLGAPIPSLRTADP